MPHPLTELKVETVIKPPGGTPTHEINADVCVVGAGIAGTSAAIEAARLGRDVVLVDALPVLGGQMVNSLIGLFAGVFGNAPEYRQLTHGIFDEIFADLDALGPGHLHFTKHHTCIVHFDEVALGRWVEKKVRELGIRVVLGAVIQRVEVADGRVRTVTLATRYGDVTIAATGFIDSSGDAALAWEAGLPCWLPERTIYGSQQAIIEFVDEEHTPDREEMAARLAARHREYGLTRQDGLAFFFPGRGTAVLNMTHIEAPLDPVEASDAQIDGRTQADRALEFLRAEYPKAFGNARMRGYGFPGRRQTRWIKARHQLTADEVRAGTKFDDAVARTAWPIELHDRVTGYVWETFDADHVHYVPLRSMTPPDVHNLLAAGRCVDGDPAALSSVRVMGPCAAMGAGAAHALDLAGTGSVHDIDLAKLRERLRPNLED
ncbi:MAG TPA: FAD-dependent oxidoreductase [Streptosporangiaceae bacterium]|nr:FAD-dependent oxidoreductase [Streptosporangiaceae bacterium]